MEEILCIEQLTKDYGRLRAVDHLDLLVEKGNIFGILGPNGSGKTTTLSVIMGLLPAGSGRFSWFGGLNGSEVNRRIGSLIEIPYFYPYLTLYQNLQLVARIREVDEADITRVLGITNLLIRKHSRFDTLSLGMKQRMGLASVLLGDPEVLVLDEPTNGLDPEGIAEVRKIIMEEGERGKTILLASHILDEVEKVCTHVAVLKMGKLIASGRVEELLGGESLVVVECERCNELREALIREEMVSHTEIRAGMLHLILRAPHTPADLNAFAHKKGFMLSRLEPRKKSLEDQFLELVR